MQNPESSNRPPDLSKGTPPPTNTPYEAPGAPPSAPSPMGAPVGAGSPMPPQNSANPVSTDVIGQAWELLKPQIGMWVVAILIYIAITGVFSVLSGIVGAVGGEDPSIIATFLSLLINVASTLVGFLVVAGLIKMALHHIRTGQAEIGKMFEITDVIAPVLIAGIIVTIATFAGFLLLIIPGVIVALGLSMVNPLIVDQKTDAIESIKRSWETCKPHLGALFLLYLVLGLVNLAGACACGLGLFVTLPLTQLAIALTYRNLFGLSAGEAGTMPSASPFPPPPIASPQ